MIQTGTHFYQTNICHIFPGVYYIKLQLYSDSFTKRSFLQVYAISAIVIYGIYHTLIYLIHLCI